jgi:hypothetical protein
LFLSLEHAILFSTIKIIWVKFGYDLGKIRAIP